MFPFTSLDAVSAIGPGASRDLQSVLRDHTLFVTTTGNPSTVTVDLDGSLDGSQWFDLGLVSGNGVGHFTGKPVRYVRAELRQFSGGTSPTVTAAIASA